MVKAIYRVAASGTAHSTVNAEHAWKTKNAMPISWPCLFAVSAMLLFASPAQSGSIVLEKHISCYDDMGDRRWHADVH